MRTLTLDGGLLREATLLPAVRTLANWQAEGKIELFECDRISAVAAPVASSRMAGMQSRYRGPRRGSSTGPSFQRISSVLFPRRDPSRLNMTEINDVAHLVHHYSLGHAMFVTTNVKDFIADGKREHLKAAFNLLVFTPDEAVGALTKAGAELSSVMTTKVAVRGTN